MEIWQITETEVEYSSFLTKEDVDKWCYSINGLYYGFKDTYEEAKEAYNNLYPERED